MESKLEIMRQDIKPCPDHPDYRALRKPRVCQRCYEIWLSVKSWEKVDEIVKKLFDKV